ncbi:MAG TPA: hypothetical protein VG676_17010 [Chitinophagaceae bacterium]|jgi:hypothetical protein|nr:hypothetical protein [Chitinophagaceae bacterium]
MKRKTFYLLVVICCLSVISSAKQANYNCCKKIGCIINESALQQPVKAGQKSGTDYALSPLQLFVFNL